MRIHLNRSALYLLFFLSFFLHPKAFPLLQGCAWWEPDDIKDNSMFIPEMIDSKEFDPFFLSIWDYYSAPDDSDPYTFRSEASEGPDFNAMNAQEWQAYLNVDTNLNLNFILYEIPESGVDTLLMAAKGKLKEVPPVYRPAIGRKAWIPAFEYLKLAKQLSKAMHVNEYYWGEPELDITVLKKLHAEFLQGYSTARQPFLKARYGFQYVRTCRALGLYKEGVEFGEREFSLSPEQAGSMYVRIKGHLAGCLYHLGMYAQSNLEFARIYDLGGYYRYIGLQSFHPQNEIDWAQTLALTKNSKEKELLWHLMGVYADPVRGMEEILKLNPESKYLPLLLVRAVQIGERHQISNPQFDVEFENWSMSDFSQFTPDPLYSWSKVKSDEFNRLEQVCTQIAALRKQDTPLWHLASAYLSWMQGKVDQSEELIAKAQQSTNNPAVKNQISILELLIEFERSKTLTAADEAKLLYRIQRLPDNEKRARSSVRYVLRQIKSILTSRGDFVWAELAWPTPDSYFYTNNDVQPLIDIFLKADQLSPFRKYLVDRYPLKLVDLYDIQATQEIYRTDFEQALNIYNKHPEAGLTELAGNPFNHRIVDCHDCDHAMPQKVKYSKRSFVEKMLELKGKISSSSEKQEKANNAFLFANGLYNMTWYGNGRLIRQTAVSFDYFDSNRFAYLTEEDTLEFGPFYDCRPAAEFYMKAFALSSDSEFKARCIWMAAKCEHNYWLETQYKSNDDISFQSGENFRRLKNEFGKTKYFTKVIDECGYFCQFIQGPGTQSCIRNK